MDSKLYTTLAAQLNDNIGLHLSPGSAFAGQDGTFHIPAADLVTLAALANLAKSAVCETSSQPEPTSTETPKPSGRDNVNWSEAGRKSWVTRRARACAQKGTRVASALQ